MDFHLHIQQHMYLRLRQTLLGSKVETGRKHVTLVHVHVHVEVVPSK